MNAALMICAGVAAVALIVFLIMRNRKDKREFEKYLNNDYPKTKNTEGDVEID